MLEGAYSDQGHLMRVVSNVMVRVDVVLGAYWNNQGQISLWPMVNEMDWFNSAGVLTSFWKDSAAVPFGNDEEGVGASAIAALKQSRGFGVAQAVFKEVLRTHGS